MKVRLKTPQGVSLLCGLLVSLAAFSNTAAAQDSSAMKRVGTVAFSGYDELMKDIDFIGNLGNVPGMSQQVEAMIGAMTQNKGLAGLDKTKPIGVIVQVDANDAPSGVVCLPVTSFEELTGVLAPFGIQSQSQADGTWQITAQGQTLFAKVAGGWAFLAPMPQMLENLPADPGADLGKLTDEYDLGVRIDLQNVPEAYKQMLIQQFRSATEEGMKQLPDESDEDYAERTKLMEQQFAEMDKALRQIDQVTVGLALDSQKQRTFLDFAYTAVPGSDLAGQIAAAKDSKTDYAGFLQPDAAMMLSTSSKVTDLQKSQMGPMFDTYRNQIHNAIDKESDLPDEEAKNVAKAAADDFLDALEATMAAGKFDGGAVLNLGADKATFVTGGFIADTAKVESGLKKLAELPKKSPEFPGVNWNADSYGDFTFHTMDIPVPDHEEEARQLFGETAEIVVGIGKDSVYFAAGRDPLAAVKSIIDASKSSPGKAIAPMEMAFSLTQILDLMKSVSDDENLAQIEMVSDMLANEANGRDHVRIVATTIPNGVRTRIEAEEGVLRAIGLMVMQAQMQQAGAGF